MGFNFHQDMRFFLMVAINTIIWRSKEAPNLRTFHHRRIVFIGRQHVIRRVFKGVFDHFEQRFRLSNTIDNPIGVKNLMAAVLRVGLRKHV